MNIIDYLFQNSAFNLNLSERFILMILLYINLSASFTGRLAVSVQPLRIGRCSRTDAFYGYFDFVSDDHCSNHQTI